MKEYEEPWRGAKNGRYTIESDDGRVYIGQLSETRLRDRAIACVNALQGMDPAALQTLIEAAHSTVAWSNYFAGRGFVGHMKREEAEQRMMRESNMLRDAISALKGATP